MNARLFFGLGNICLPLLTRGAWGYGSLAARRLQGLRAVSARTYNRWIRSDNSACVRENVIGPAAASLHFRVVLLPAFVALTMQGRRVRHL